MPIQTVAEHMKQNTSCWVAKKGKRYITVRFELGLTANQNLAAAFTSTHHATALLEHAAIDDRNAAIIGRSYKLVQITK